MNQPTTPLTNPTPPNFRIQGESSRSARPVVFVGPQVMLVRAILAVTSRIIPFLLLTSLSILISVAYYFLKTPEYEARAVLELSLSDNLPKSLAGLTPNAEILDRRLSEQYDIENRSMRSRTLPLIRGVQHFNNILILESRGKSAAEAQQFLDERLKQLETEVWAPIQTAEQLLEGFVDEEKSRITYLNTQLDKMSAPAEIAKITDPSLAGLISFERERSHERLAQLHEQHFTKKLSLLGVQQSSLRRLKGPEVLYEGEPAVPRFNTCISLGVVIGLISSFCAILAWDIGVLSWRRFKNISHQIRQMNS